MIVTIENNQIVSKHADGMIDQVIKSVEDFNMVCANNGGSVLCSSTMDFPDEATDDETVIALAKAIRGEDEAATEKTRKPAKREHGARVIMKAFTDTFRSLWQANIGETGKY